MGEKTRYRTIAGTWGAFLIASAMFYSPPVLPQTGVPKYEVDPFWAKLPNNWVVGPLGGACVDARDHVFVLHRQDELTEAVLTARDQFAGGAARIKAPPVMEFDPEGNLVNSWGDTKVLGSYLHDWIRTVMCGLPLHVRVRAEIFARWETPASDREIRRFRFFRRQRERETAQFECGAIFRTLGRRCGSRDRRRLRRRRSWRRELPNCGVG